MATDRRLGVRAALVEGEVVPGDVVVDADGLVAAVGEGPASGVGLAVPGFVDLQVNGFAGVTFLTADAAGWRAASDAMARHGVTSFQPTLVTAPDAAVVEALRVAGAGEAGGVVGVHLEGPFLSPRWKGAHDERWLQAPSVEAAARLCDAGPVTYMTMAPELPGGMDLLAWLVRRGVTVALGHTDADAAAAHAAFDAGARTVTHLFNAMRRFSSRDPGVSGAALARDDVVVQVIPDFVHLAPETVLLAWRAAGGPAARFAVVTDAVAGAGIDPPSASARLPDGTLAGSTLTMDAAVRNLVSLGVPLAHAVAAATSVPAALVGRPELGTLRPGTPADIAVLDESTLSVTRTLARGEERWRS